MVVGNVVTFSLKYSRWKLEKYIIVKCIVVRGASKILCHHVVSCLVYVVNLLTAIKLEDLHGIV